MFNKKKPGRPKKHKTALEFNKDNRKIRTRDITPKRNVNLRLPVPILEELILKAPSLTAKLGFPPETSLSQLISILVATHDWIGISYLDAKRYATKCTGRQGRPLAEDISLKARRLEVEKEVKLAQLQAANEMRMFKPCAIRHEFNPNEVGDLGEFIETNIQAFLENVKVASPYWVGHPDVKMFSPLWWALYNTFNLTVKAASLIGESELWTLLERWKGIHVDLLEKGLVEDGQIAQPIIRLEGSAHWTAAFGVEPKVSDEVLRDALKFFEFLH